MISVGALPLPAARIAAAYAAVPAMYPKLAQRVVRVAQDLGVNPYSLANLIYAESEFDPQARRGKNGPVGLIQFTASTADSLGVTQDQLLSLDAAEQMGFVRDYLARYGPFPTKQALYLSVFYPAARTWPAHQRFPPHVPRLNPGIHTPSDYIAWVDRRALIREDGTFKAPV